MQWCAEETLSDAPLSKIRQTNKKKEKAVRRGNQIRVTMARETFTQSSSEQFTERQ